MISFQRLVALTVCVLVGWIGTVPSARAQVAVFEEHFDLTDAPIGWMLEEGWFKSSSTPSPGSGTESLQNRGNALASAITPTIDLSAATSASLSYLARRTAAYETGNLTVSVSVDGGESFPVLLLETGSAVPDADSKWQLISVALPDVVLGSGGVVIRFDGQGLSSAGANVRIDDVTITADVPVSVSPLVLSFSASVGTAEAKSVSLTNHTSEPLTVETPSLTGTGFTIDPGDPVVIPGGSTRTYSITFGPTVRGVVTGSAEFDFGVGRVKISLSGTAAGGVLEFSTDASDVVAELSGVAVPLRLTFISMAGLQGLQFRVAWTSDVLTVSGVERGEAVSDADDWTLSFEPGPGYVDVVLLGQGALTGGTYDNLLVLHFNAASVDLPTEIPLSIQNVIGAMAEPEGSDADLSASSSGHLVTVRPGGRFFEPSATNLDVGLVTVGEVGAATLTVSNPGGNDMLVITHAAASNALFAVSPDFAEISPDESQEFAITFTPTSTSFGRQTGEITFTHNGEGQADTISITGKGRGGRGDVVGDGTVDAMDVVHAIDFVLHRLTPDPVQEVAADLFPFPVGDGALDVRDLTVLARAIVSGRWPDDVDLPADESDAGGTSPSGIRLSAGPQTIELTIERPIRAFQVVLPAVGEAFVNLDASDADATIAFGVDKSAGELRVLVYRLDGSSIEPGAIRIATQGVLGRPRYVAVIGENRDRLVVDASVWTGIESPPEMKRPGKPFPNPFRVGVDVLTIPTGTESTSVRVYDVLGRLVIRRDHAREFVEWTGEDGTGRYVGAGLYIIKVSTAHGHQIHTIQVIR